jgi:hypothetical protein
MNECIERIAKGSAFIAMPVKAWRSVLLMEYTRLLPVRLLLKAKKVLIIFHPKELL